MYNIQLDLLFFCIKREEKEGDEERVKMILENHSWNVCTLNNTKGHVLDVRCVGGELNWNFRE